MFLQSDKRSRDIFLWMQCLFFGLIFPLQAKIMQTKQSQVSGAENRLKHPCTKTNGLHHHVLYVRLSSGPITRCFNSKTYDDWVKLCPSFCFLATLYNCLFKWFFTFLVWMPVGVNTAVLGHSLIPDQLKKWSNCTNSTGLKCFLLWNWQEFSLATH